MAYVLPGERISTPNVNLKLGPGLLQETSKNNESIIVATRAGELKHSANNRRWHVDSNSWRYVPAPQEFVVGTVITRTTEGFRVDIGSAHMAALDGLAFEGATKRNKPNLKVGSVVFARVSLAHKDMEPELECFDAQTHKAEGFGELKHGFVIRCSLKMSRLLLDPTYFLFPLIGARFPFDSAIGVNGRVWIDSKDPRHVIAAARCIEKADPAGENMDDAGIKTFLNTLEI